MPLVHASRPREEMEQVAIEEWMAASPVYSRRTQRALALRRRRRADDPEEHPARHRRAAPLHGLPLPGRRRRARRVLARALRRAHGRRADGRGVRARDVPRRSRTRPSTRPRSRRTRARRCGRSTARRASRPTASRTATGRSTIDRRRRTGRRAPERRDRRAVARSRAIAIDEPDGDAEPGGWDDYTGDFDPDFELEDLSHSRARRRAAGGRGAEPPAVPRVPARGRAARTATTKRRAINPQVFTGLAGLTAQRLRDALGIDGDDATAIAKLLQLHPMFYPRTYVDLAVEVVDDDARALRDRSLPRARRGRRVHVVRAARRRRRPRRSTRSCRR